MSRIPDMPKPTEFIYKIIYITLLPDFDEARIVAGQTFDVTTIANMSDFRIALSGLQQPR